MVFVLCGERVSALEKYTTRHRGDFAGLARNIRARLRCILGNTYANYRSNGDTMA